MTVPEQAVEQHKIMYICTGCADAAPEACGHYDPNELRVMPDGRWLCDGCFDNEGPEGASWSSFPIPPEFAATPLMGVQQTDVARATAVEEWFKLHDAYHKASAAYNARLAFVTERREKFDDWEPNVHTEYRILSDAQRAAIGAAETLYQTLLALPAQSGSAVMRREDVVQASEEKLVAAVQRWPEFSRDVSPSQVIPAWGENLRAVAETIADAVLALHTGQPVEGCGTEVTVGLGLVDIGPIKHEGSHGVLIRPRETHIPYGEPGELQNTEYLPRKGDVTIWIDGEGPQVLITELSAFLSAAPASPQKREGWQPIDDKARDGSLILAGSINHDTRAVVGYVVGTGDPEDPLIGEDHWDDVGGLNRAPALFFNQHFFTHYQPIDPPPVIADERQP